MGQYCTKFGLKNEFHQLRAFIILKLKRNSEIGESSSFFRLLKKIFLKRHSYQLKLFKAINCLIGIINSDHLVIFRFRNFKVAQRKFVDAKILFFFVTWKFRNLKITKLSLLIIPIKVFKQLRLIVIIKVAFKNMFLNNISNTKLRRKIA